MHEKNIETLSEMAERNENFIKNILKVIIMKKI